MSGAEQYMKESVKNDVQAQHAVGRMAEDVGSYMTASWNSNVNRAKAIGSAYLDYSNYVTTATWEATKAAGNELWKENKDVVQGTADAFTASNQNVAEHFKNRPMTAAAELAFNPAVAYTDAQMRGHSDGKPHPDHRAAVTKPEEKEVAKAGEQAERRITNANSDKNGGAAPEHKHKIKSGESYWSIARQELQAAHKAMTNSDITKEAKELQAKNQNKTLLPNLEIIV